MALSCNQSLSAEIFSTGSTALTPISLSRQDVGQSKNTLIVDGGKLLLHHESRFSSSEKLLIQRWLTTSAHAATLLTGSFPVQETTVKLFRYDKGTSPVPWANTVRSHPEGVNFYINTKLDIQAFNADWTAVHEFSHLHLPYLGISDRWLAEGFASYYQNVLMARANLQSDETAWKKLNAGFERGANDSNQDIDLRRLSREMRERRGHMRIYWSGALFFLEADIILRRSGSSLDQVIKQFAECCRKSNHNWNGKKLMQRFDEIVGQGLFIQMYDRYRKETSFPNHELILASIGVSQVAGTLHVDNAQPHAALRRGIMDN